MKNETIERLKNLNKKKRQILEETRKEFYRISRDESLDEKEKENLYDLILSDYPSGEFDIGMVSKMKDSRGASYVSSITQLIRIKRHLKKIGVLLAPGGNDKSKDICFAKEHGVKTPKVHQDRVPAADIKLIPKTVIKPVSGAASTGVFIVQEDLKLKSVVTGCIFEDLAVALSGIKLSTKLFKVEELVSLGDSPAHDLKIFSFYGEPFLALEIKRLGGKRQYCWYNGEGKPIDPELAMRPHKNISYFLGNGVDDEAFDYQKRLSLNTPVPFLRIDLLKGDSGYYLGEITPHPGFYYEGISDLMNNKMGAEFDKSWARLMKDLLNGKKFTSYFNIYR